MFNQPEKLQEMREMIRFDRSNLIIAGDKSELRILEFLKKIDASFNPKLSTKVDLVTYSKKLSKLANVFFARLNNTDIGIVAFYTNFDSKKAYITVIGVRPDDQRKGFGRCLLDLVVDHAQENKMNYLELEVDIVNTSAIKFYWRNGFTPSTSKDKNNNSSFYMVKYLPNSKITDKND